MKDGKLTKGRLGVFLMGIGFMGILYGWIVYAGEIETEMGNIASAIASASNNQIKLDPDMIQLLNQVDNGVEVQQNNSINAELYNSNSILSILPSPSGANNAISPADALITNHFGKYCAQNIESGSCPNDALLQYGDIKVSSILSGTTYNTVRAQAAQDFLTNLLSPPAGPNVANFQANVPMNIIKLTEDPALKSSFVQALSEEALLSIARQSFAEMIAKRTPASAGGYSEMQMMEQQAIQRIMSSSWAGTLAQMQPDAILKDKALMQAYQVWMEYQRYRQMERVEALLSALVLQNFRMGKALSNAAQPPSQQQINSTLQQTGTGSVGTEEGQ